MVVVDFANAVDQMFAVNTFALDFYFSVMFLRLVLLSSVASVF